MSDFIQDPRAALDRLLTDKGIDYARLSQVIGRNPRLYPAIYQARVAAAAGRTGPRANRRLSGGIRSDAGGPVQRIATPSRVRGPGMILVPKLAIGASAGAGASVDGEPVEGEVAFDPKWLRGLGADPRALSIIRVEGDSMAPTLDDGDDILVDGGDAARAAARRHLRAAHGRCADGEARRARAGAGADFGDQRQSALSQLGRSADERGTARRARRLDRPAAV